MGWVPMSAVVRIRGADRQETELPIGRVRAEDVLGATPWRKLRWYRGQRHIPGWYWSSTNGGYVTYESRLELARLLLADMARDVVGIASKPFLLEDDDEAAGRQRRHVPDFFLSMADGASMVVNVKPAERLEKPEFADALEWAGRVLADRGWRTEVWSGADPQVLANVRFLAGYRRAWMFEPRDLETAWAAVADGDAAGEVEARLLGAGVSQPRPLLLHLVWTGRLVIDLSLPFGLDTRLEPGA